MSDIQRLLANNRTWSADIRRRDPEFFPKLARQQKPSFLWIGCADSRVPANEIVGLLPGEMFVHRNIANVVAHSDLNCLSVLQYAIDVLQVRHIIVCGHYGCSGVRAVVQGQRVGLADNWLRHVEDVWERHDAAVSAAPTLDAKVDRLCECNVVAQAANVARTTVARDAWARGQPLAVHGWIYGLGDGLVRDLGVTVDHAAGA
ncbi:MAG TPA: carbonate dehydratase [Opitutaceae bacterium]|nr:carbonate dehydratase [Opitutaceae bacterium]